MTPLEKTYVLAFTKAAQEDSGRRQKGSFWPSVAGSTIGGAAGTGGALWLAYELAKKKFGPMVESARSEIKGFTKLSPLQKLMYLVRKRK